VRPCALLLDDQFDLAAVGLDVFFGDCQAEAAAHDFAALGAMAAGGLQAGAQLASQQMVTLQGPDGSVKQVPQAQAQHYIQLGAKPVQQ
jgi:hypothetical protein